MIRFGTGGWREIIGDGFTKANVQRLMTAIAQKMHAEGVASQGFLIGYDRRFLSREAAMWAAEVSAAHRIHTYLINRPAPTPVIMFGVQHWHLPYGAAITASHNPAIYNGVKLFVQGGRDAQAYTTDAITEACQGIAQEDICAIPFEEAVAAGCIEEVNPFDCYFDAILRTINTDAIRRRDLQIVIDPMYGVSCASLQTILLTARCNVQTIHERHDPLFGGCVPAPTEETLRPLRFSVLHGHADLGIATDGDADRLGVIDDAGHFVHPNQILVLLYDYLLRYKGWRGPAVRNLSTTHLVDRVAAAFGQTCYEVPVGFKHVSDAMEKYDALIGGESSGGLTVRGHIQGKDGIYAAALLVEMLAVTSKSLSERYAEITEQFGELVMVEEGRPFAPEQRENLTNMLLKERMIPAFADPPQSVSYLDGVKFRWAEGWLGIRFSGTEPLLRLVCEMPTKKQAEAVLAEIVTLLGL